MKKMKAEQPVIVEAKEFELDSLRKTIQSQSDELASLKESAAVPHASVTTALSLFDEKHSDLEKTIVEINDQIKLNELV